MVNYFYYFYHLDTIWTHWQLQWAHNHFFRILVDQGGGHALTCFMDKVSGKEGWSDSSSFRCTIVLHIRLILATEAHSCCWLIWHLQIANFYPTIGLYSVWWSVKWFFCGGGGIRSLMSSIGHGLARMHSDQFELNLGPSPWSLTIHSFVGSSPPSIGACGNILRQNANSHRRCVDRCNLVINREENMDQNKMSKMEINPSHLQNLEIGVNRRTFSLNWILIWITGPD